MNSIIVIILVLICLTSSHILGKPQGDTLPEWSEDKQNFEVEKMYPESYGIMEKRRPGWGKRSPSILKSSGLMLSSFEFFI